MNPPLDDLVPLPKGVKIRVRKFGTGPVAQMEGVPQPSFELRWNDAKLGLTVILHEQAGRVRADACCVNLAMLGKAAVSVSLVAGDRDEMIRKTIALSEPDPRTGGCCGCADFGGLADVQKLGPNPGLVAFMLL